MSARFRIASTLPSSAASCRAAPGGVSGVRGAAVKGPAPRLRQVALVPWRGVATWYARKAPAGSRETPRPW